MEKQSRYAMKHKVRIMEITSKNRLSEASSSRECTSSNKEATYRRITDITSRRPLLSDTNWSVLGEFYCIWALTGPLSVMSLYRFGLKSWKPWLLACGMDLSRLVRFLKSFSSFRKKNTFPPKLEKTVFFAWVELLGDRKMFELCKKSTCESVRDTTFDVCDNSRYT